jgi:hypothetical protein
MNTVSIDGRELCVCIFVNALAKCEDKTGYIVSRSVCVCGN